MHNKPATLNYAAPHVFFEGSYRHRNVNQFMGSLMLLAGAIGILYALWRRLITDKDSRPILLVIGNVFLRAGGWVLCLWFTDHTQKVRITEEGIEYEGSIWPLFRVERLGGVQSNGGVAFEANVRELAFARCMSTTPSLTLEEFRDVMKSVQSHLGIQPGFMTELDLNIRIPID